MLRIIVYMYILIFDVHIDMPCFNLTVDSLFIEVDADRFAFSSDGRLPITWYRYHPIPGPNRK